VATNEIKTNRASKVALKKLEQAVNLLFNIEGYVANCCI